MEEFGCDYRCKTVGESICKYNIPDDWCAEFDACGDIYPIICIQVDQIRRTSAMMGLKLRVVENGDSEYAGCMIFAEKKTIAFKIDNLSDLVQATNTLIIPVDSSRCK